MGKLVFGMLQSLDGYVDGVADRLEFPPPGVALSRHFNDHVRGLAGCLYGRRMYEIVRYWDEDRPDCDADERDFAAGWRAQPKWVVSRTLNRSARTPHSSQRPSPPPSGFWRPSA